MASQQKSKTKIRTQEVGTVSFFAQDVSAGPKPNVEKTTGTVGYAAYSFQRYAQFVTFEGTNRSSWYWDVSGHWVVTFEYLGSYYAHDMYLTQGAKGT